MLVDVVFSVIVVCLCSAPLRSHSQGISHFLYTSSTTLHSFAVFNMTLYSLHACER